MNIDDLHAGHESIVEINLIKIFDEITYDIVNYNSLPSSSSNVLKI
jgi:hypothetical protein